jgi:hypothetical protein
MRPGEVSRVSTAASDPGAKRAGVINLAHAPTRSDNPTTDKRTGRLRPDKPNNWRTDGTVPTKVDAQQPFPLLFIFPHRGACQQGAGCVLKLKI